MNIGVKMSPTTETLHPAELARLVEAYGFESLFFPEHTHIPLATESLEPDDPEWLEDCKRMLDPFIALMAAASATERLRLGTGVSLILEHDPIVLSKEVATLDQLSGGRVLLGVGAGWNRVEMAHHGIDPARRWPMLREYVLAIRRLWSDELAEFHGRFVDFAPSFQWPKPLQQPGIPILLGGESPRILERVVDYGDGWIPNEHPEVERRITELNQRLADLGRASLPVTIYSCVRDRTRIEGYASAGVERCVFSIDAFGRDDVERSLQALVDLVGDLMTFED
jgi:probable F420-dependent oxidoreductase